jgi:hypothetical protein
MWTCFCFKSESGSERLTKCYICPLTLSLRVLLTLLCRVFVCSSRFGHWRNKIQHSCRRTSKHRQTNTEIHTALMYFYKLGEFLFFNYANTACALSWMMHSGPWCAFLYRNLLICISCLSVKYVIAPCLLCVLFHLEYEAVCSSETSESS